jgi:hypothetical protein
MSVRGGQTDDPSRFTRRHRLVIDITHEYLAQIEAIKFLMGAKSKRQVLLAGVAALALAAVKNDQLQKVAMASAGLKPAA